MLLHEVSFQDPHCRDCQLHHAALGFFAQQRLAQQIPEHSVAEVATACMRMVLALIVSMPCSTTIQPMTMHVSGTKVAAVWCRVKFSY